MVSEYTEVASQIGAASTKSRVTDTTFYHEGIYNDNFFDMRKSKHFNKHYHLIHSPRDIITDYFPWPRDFNHFLYHVMLPRVISRDEWFV